MRRCHLRAHLRRSHAVCRMLLATCCVPHVTCACLPRAPRKKFKVPCSSNTIRSAKLAERLSLPVAYVAKDVLSDEGSSLLKAALEAYAQRSVAVSGVIAQLGDL